MIREPAPTRCAANGGIGLQAAFLLGGVVLAETIFSWPGAGRLPVGAIVSSDFRRRSVRS